MRRTNMQLDCHLAFPVAPKIYINIIYTTSRPVPLPQLPSTGVGRWSIQSTVPRNIVSCRPQVSRRSALEPPHASCSRMSSILSSIHSHRSCMAGESID
jgi:hypothetical protein